MRERESENWNKFFTSSNEVKHKKKKFFRMYINSRKLTLIVNCKIKIPNQLILSKNGL